MKTIQKGRIGFVLWLLTCTLGSFIVVSIERYHWNKTEGHFMSIPDLILLGGIVTAIALISSTPTILSIYFLFGKSKNLGLLINLSLIITLLVGFFVVTYLSKSIFDAIQILGPYFLLAFISKYFFLKIERTATSIK
jgi:hypothetical protein